MIKGPLVYAALILAAILMGLSSMMVLARDFFFENSTIVLCISGIVALAVIVVLFLIFLRTRNQTS
jgi:hypothetical protein